MKDSEVYCYGRRGEQYGIWNSVQKCWQFGICEDTPMLARARLVQKIGNDSRKWRFQERPLPKEMRQSEPEPPDKATLIELQRKDRQLKELKKQLHKAEAKWTAKTDPGQYAKLIQDLRGYANQYRSGETLGRAIEATAEVMDEAAKAVDALARELDCKDQRIKLIKKELCELKRSKKIVQRGRWVIPHDKGANYCSVCKSLQLWSTGQGYWDFPYCPYCGAKMDNNDN